VREVPEIGGAEETGLSTGRDCGVLERFVFLALMKRLQQRESGTEPSVPALLWHSSSVPGGVGVNKFFT